VKWCGKCFFFSTTSRLALILVLLIAREAYTGVVTAVAKECAGISQNEVNILPDELLFVNLGDFLR
jgi:hypothetical protein